MKLYAVPWVAERVEEVVVAKDKEEPLTVVVSIYHHNKFVGRSKFVELPFLLSLTEVKSATPEPGPGSPVSRRDGDLCVVTHLTLSSPWDTNTGHTYMETKQQTNMNWQQQNTVIINLIIWSQGSLAMVSPKGSPPTLNLPSPHGFLLFLSQRISVCVLPPYYSRLSRLY